MDFRSAAAIGTGLIFIFAGWAILYLSGNFWADAGLTILGTVVLIAGVVTYFIPDIGTILSRTGKD